MASASIYDYMDDGSQDNGMSRPQVQDQWGRSPGDANYGQPPTKTPEAGGFTGGGTGDWGQQPSAPTTGTSAQFGGGWDQYATDPKSFQYGLKQALGQGLQGDQALEWMQVNGWSGAVNPNGTGIQYYPGQNQFGLPGGYKVVPGQGGAYDIYQVGAGGGQAPVDLSNAPQPSGGPTLYATGSAPSAAGTAAAGMTNLGSEADNLYQALLKRSQQGLDINPNDPIIRNQTDAYNAQQQQARRNYLRETAERQGPGANITAEERASAEGVGQATSGFQAQLMAHELESRRQEIQDALTSQQAFLTDRQRMDLQKQLAELDNALQYARLGEQGREFGQSLGQRQSEFDRTLGQHAYEYDTSRYDNLFA